MTDVLRLIGSPKDLNKLSYDELDILAGEIRKLIIQTVSHNGGHLASNLGTVELTLALHRVFDFSKDKLIFDVSHQAYTHKIITGRKTRFSTLRQYRGISGYTNPFESKFDTFIAGHSSTSLSLALGFATVRELKKEKYEIVAVIGDGALTAGEAYEGLNNLGRAGKKVIIVLNDNEMSISKNVGAISQYLSHVRSSSFYQTIKSKLPRTIIGKRIKLSIKNLFMPTVFFEELGFTYLGPIDGHDIKKLEKTFQRTKNIPSSVVVHIVTKKGKGYQFAEENPSKFHSAHPFIIQTGKSKSKTSKKTFSEIFGEALVEESEKDERVFAITAAMQDGTKTNLVKNMFPDRFMDVGIAEQCAVTTAAGMAKAGLKPVVAIYSTFLQRAYDQLVHDIGILKVPVVFALDRAGVVSADGPTHQGIFDLSYMRTIPSFVVMAPKDDAELKAMLHFALTLNIPSSIRYPKDYAKENTLPLVPVEMGKAEPFYSGSDLLIVSIGVMFYPALEAREMLQKNGISAGLINARFVKPLDGNLILSEAKKSGRVITVEDNTIKGGFGDAVTEFLSQYGIRVRIIGINDFFPEQGDRKFLMEKYGLSAEHIVEVGEEFVKEKN